MDMSYKPSSRYNRTDSEKLENIDYKNLKVLAKYITEARKIIPSRINGLSARAQRKLAQEIKRARTLALLPYCDRHK